VWRVLKAVWFLPLLAAAALTTTVGSHLYYTLSERLNDALTVGRVHHFGQADLMGTRFYVDRFAPEYLQMLGGFHRPSLMPAGYGLRLGSADGHDALYIGYRLHPTMSYSVAIQGENVFGRTLLQVRCRDNRGSDPASDEPGNLLKNGSDLTTGHRWFGPAERVTAGVSGPDGRPSASRVELTLQKPFIYQVVDNFSDRRKHEVLEMSFWARLVSGGPRMYAFVSRDGGSDDESTTFELTPEWKFYVLLHDEVWTGETDVQAGLHVSANTVVFDVWDVRLTTRSTDARVVTNWIAQGWIESGPERAAGPVVPLDDGQTTLSLSGVPGFALILFGDRPFSYRLDRVRIVGLGFLSANQSPSCDGRG
jgi:hypothetical protein